MISRSSVPSFTYKAVSFFLQHTDLLKYLRIILMTSQSSSKFLHFASPTACPPVKSQASLISSLLVIHLNLSAIVTGYTQPPPFVFLWLCVFSSSQTLESDHIKSAQRPPKCSSHFMSDRMSSARSFISKDILAKHRE